MSTIATSVPPLSNWVHAFVTGSAYGQLVRHSIHMAKCQEGWPYAEATRKTPRRLDPDPETKPATWPYPSSCLRMYRLPRPFHARGAWNTASARTTSAFPRSATCSVSLDWTGFGVDSSLSFVPSTANGAPATTAPAAAGDYARVAKAKSASAVPQKTGQPRCSAIL
jgi:hypothetical protein